jgi:hypothetical protein
MDAVMKIQLLEDVRRMLPNAQDAVVVNWPDEQEIAETKVGDYFVWTGYVKPGLHSYVVARRA